MSTDQSYVVRTLELLCCQLTAASCEQATDLFGTQRREPTVGKRDMLPAFC